MKKAIAILIISIFGLVTIGQVGANENKSGGSYYQSLLEGGKNIETGYCDKGSGNNDECSLGEGIEAAKKVNGVKTDGDIIDYIVQIVSYVLSFTTVLAVLYIIYAGYLILMSAGNEEQMGKARQNIIYVIVGMIVIYLANAIVMFIINSVLDEGDRKNIYNNGQAQESSQ